jgi:hypothetical protein
LINLGCFRPNDIVEALVFNWIVQQLDLTLIELLKEILPVYRPEDSSAADLIRAKLMTGFIYSG